MGFVSQNDILQQLRLQVSLQSEMWNSKSILRLLVEIIIYANVEELLVKRTIEKGKYLYKYSLLHSVSAAMQAESS